MRRILVIDDDPAMLTLIKRFLSGSDYDVVSARSGNAGLAELDADGIDLILTDLLMPERDGVEVLMAVKKRRPDLPVVVMSGGGQMLSQQMLDMMPLLGAAKVLEKPFRREALLQIVQELLGPASS